MKILLESELNDIIRAIDSKLKQYEDQIIRMKEQSKIFNHYVEENVNLRNKIKELTLVNQSSNIIPNITHSLAEYQDKQVDTTDLKANSSLYIDK